MMRALLALLFIFALAQPAAAAANFTGGSGIRFAASYNALSFRMRTTQATANVGLMMHVDQVNSRSGLQVILNSTAHKLVIGVENAAGYVGSCVGTTTVDDGNWHDVLVNISYTTGPSTDLYVDGNLDCSAAASAAWGPTGTPLQIARSLDAFWGAYSGDVAEVAGFAARLTTDQIGALHRGFTAPRVGRVFFYAPLIRDRFEFITSATITTTGTPTVADHPRVVGR